MSEQWTADLGTVYIIMQWIAFIKFVDVFHFDLLVYGTTRLAQLSCMYS